LVCKEAVKQMPRATGVLVGETYQQMLSRTLPSTKAGLDMFGIYEGIDYVVGKCGKSLGFTMPFSLLINGIILFTFRMGLFGLWLVMIKRTLGVESTAPLL
jgi:hypothetical protein